MRILNARAALLSDFEVLQLLRDMEAEQELASRSLERRRNAARKGAATSATAASQVATNGNTTASMHVDERDDQGEEEEEEEEEQRLQRLLDYLPSNLRTVQFELLAHLSHHAKPCSHQSAEQLARFASELAAWERQAGVDVAKRLTKAERLQVLNHAPGSIVELHTMVEELDDRFDEEQMYAILDVVRRTLPTPSSAEDPQAFGQEGGQAEPGELQDEGGGEGGLFLGDETAEDERMNDGSASMAQEVGEGDHVDEQEGLVEDHLQLEHEFGGEGAVDDDVAED